MGKRRSVTSLFPISFPSFSHEDKYVPTQPERKRVTMRASSVTDHSRWIRSQIDTSETNEELWLSLNRLLIAAPLLADYLSWNLSITNCILYSFLIVLTLKSCVQQYRYYFCCTVLYKCYLCNPKVDHLTSSIVQISQRLNIAWFKNHHFQTFHMGKDYGERSMYLFLTGTYGSLFWSRYRHFSVSVGGLENL